MKKARVLLTLALAIALFISIIPVSNAAEPYSFGRDYISQGDANLDGRVNSGDALYILKYVRGDFDLISDLHKNIADANGDGVIDISDAIELLEAPSLPPHAILAVPVYIGDVNLDGVISASDANPVSYTHLDVYKRQGRTERLCGRGSPDDSHKQRLQGSFNRLQGRNAGRASIYHVACDKQEPP